MTRHRGEIPVDRQTDFSLSLSLTLSLSLSRTKRILLRVKEQTKFRNHGAREEGSTRRGLESLGYEAPRMRTTETAYPESKLPLQPTGQNRSSLSCSRRREHVRLVSPLVPSLALSLSLPLFPPSLSRHTSLSAIPPISPASLHPRLAVLRGTPA